MLKRSHFRPLLETLEARDVPAFAVTQSGAVLNLLGTKNGETVTIQDLGNNSIAIIQNNVETDYFGVNRVNVNAKGGNDFVTFDVVQTSVKLWINVDLGDGNDTFISSNTSPAETVSVSNVQPKLPADNQIRIDVHGGSGNDNITLAGEGNLPAGLLVTVNLWGDSGNDTIFGSLAGTNDATVNIKIDGGNGNDTIGAQFGRSTGDVSTNNGIYSLNVEGGCGNDQVSAWVGVSSGDDLNPSAGVVNNGTFSIRLDGDCGNDTITADIGTGAAFAAEIVNNGNFNVNLLGGGGRDSIRANAGDFAQVMTGGGEVGVAQVTGAYNLVNFGTFNITSDGGCDNDILVDNIYVDNEGTGSFRAVSKADVCKDSVYFNFFREGENADNALATVYANKLTNPIYVTDLVHVLNAKASNVHVVDLV